MRLAWVLAAVFLSGCASWRPDVMAEEGAQQALQVVDLGQTIDIDRRAGVQEGMAAPIIGLHPSASQALGLKVAEMALHLAVTAGLEHEHWDAAARVWEGLTIGVQGAVDERNAELGLSMRF